MQFPVVVHCSGSNNLIITHFTHSKLDLLESFFGLSASPQFGGTLFFRPPQEIHPTFAYLSLASPGSILWAQRCYDGFYVVVIVPEHIAWQRL
jgi:hypothetical protein